jgi:hypothetical protein
VRWFSPRFSFLNRDLSGQAGITFDFIICVVEVNSGEPGLPRAAGRAVRLMFFSYCARFLAS